MYGPCIIFLLWKVIMCGRASRRGWIWILRMIRWIRWMVHLLWKMPWIRTVKIAGNVALLSILQCSLDGFVALSDGVLMVD